ncbi:MAG: hypothetical protein HXX12_15005 [Geothrix sp.]|uniref:hypothetical protein n=1 Tax=Geothrix sp. TaxID=1962974 RepID=UPI0017FF1544|nr:hypothetical protein [Geothrix sp.]NWJ42270.1 hypothetical protein [Geothrix sp.]WIL19763.1 MAG: hypothetical protein QOZ81_002295 [Geothrix sp.]
MPWPTPPPPTQVVQLTPDLPLLPGSDPMILGAYQWALAHSPSLQQVVSQLPGADRKARYRLVPGLDPDYGSLLVGAPGDIYEIDIRVTTLPWIRCGDAIEPWIASAIYLALETATNGRWRETGDKQKLRFTHETRQGAFALQAKVRTELMAADPERLKDLPDGELLFRYGFQPGVYPPSHSRRMPEFSRTPTRRGLPKGMR